MKRMLAVVLAIAVLCAAAVVSAEVVGSKNAKKYHHPDCSWVKRINEQNVVKFAGPAEAEKGGYVPCKVCNASSAQEKPAAKK